MDKIAENTNKLLNFIENKFESGELDNSSLVQIFELTGMMLNVKSISDFQRDNGKSYNGVKKSKQVRKVNNIKYLIDNE
jgi:hypothetical protein